MIWRGENLELVGDGLYDYNRQVYLGKDIVLKQDFTPQDFENLSTNKKARFRQTLREIDFYQTLTEDKEFFPEILHYERGEHSLIVEKRYEHCQKMVNSSVLQLVKDICFKYGIKDVYYGDTDGSCNWLVTARGEVIIYDFGA